MPPKPTTPKKSKKQIEDDKKRLEEKKRNVEEAIDALFGKIVEEWMMEVGLPPIAAEIVEEHTPVLIDPLTEIGRMDFRHVKELHLGKRGMTDIHLNFSRFIFLEELWLNGNKLKRVTNLMDPRTLREQSMGSKSILDKPVKTGCMRLKHLYLQQNRIESLDINNFSNFKFLESLLLHENNLRNLDEVMDCFKGMRHLKQLTLFGNPLCDSLPTREYRAHVVLGIPSLRVFDRTEVTTLEREELASSHHQSNRMPFSGNSVNVSSSNSGREVAFGKIVPSHVIDHKTLRLSTMKPSSFMGATAELAVKNAKTIKKEHAIMSIKKEEEERASMEKILLNSKVKQYFDQEERERNSTQVIFDNLSHVYRDFDGLLLMDNEVEVIANFIQNNHPAFRRGKTMVTIKANEMRELLDNLGISKFTEKWFKSIEEKPNSIIEDEKKKVALFKRIVVQNEVSFHDLFLLICDMKSEEEFINSHDLQKQLIDKKAEFEQKKKERIERDQQEESRRTPVQANDKRPKSGKKSKGERKPTDNTEEEDHEMKQIENLSKNMATLELQAASRAIKWQTKSQVHESFRPKELKVVQKRSDVYKSHYL